ncbi:hypothetical protein [Thermoleptolyngbya sp. C42_A2020_037]|uniref:hypothetical protein n=1 Tax=Thermoleptolyngbya sp. C42_A2020_037 TaxID=2747799 RepID=UPI0025D70520|nr:hypothetical protein [Thermoleptolyngbya sp. C42_A2020_037]
MTQPPAPQAAIASPSSGSDIPPSPSPGFPLRRWLKKLRGGLVFGIGYMLSPLSWWNDLVFNLPVAYGFGYVVSRFAPETLIPCTIAGYWLSNVLGILMMQWGVVDVVQNQPQPRHLKRELLTSLATSTVYTVVILALVQFNVLQLPELVAEDGSINLRPLLSWLDSVWS